MDFAPIVVDAGETRNATTTGAVTVAKVLAEVVPTFAVMVTGPP